MRARILLALLAALGGALCGEDAEPTLILRTDGATVPVVTITQDDYVAVAGVTKTGTTVSVPAWAVKDVLYADRDANYSAALEKRGEGRNRLALLYYRKALDNMPDTKWAHEYCVYGLGSALFAEGLFKGFRGRNNEHPPPSVYLAHVLRLNSRSRFLPDIVPKLPVCLAEEGKLEEAEAALKDAHARLKAYRDETLRVASGFAAIADRAAAELAVAGARVAESKASGPLNKGAAVLPLPLREGVGGGVAEGAAQPPLTDAAAKWSVARAKSARFPELHAQAFRGHMRALETLKRSAEMQAEADAVIRACQDAGDALSPLLPAAYLALGKAHFGEAANAEARGAAIPAGKAYAEARWAFLHVSALPSPDDDTALARYLAGVCYDKLRAIESDAAGKAVREWSRVVRDFPRSAVAVAAQQELARVRAK